MQTLQEKSEGKEFRSLFRSKRRSRSKNYIHQIIRNNSRKRLTTNNRQIAFVHILHTHTHTTHIELNVIIVMARAINGITATAFFFPFLYCILFAPFFFILFSFIA